MQIKIKLIEPDVGVVNRNNIFEMLNVIMSVNFETLNGIVNRLFSTNEQIITLRRDITDIEQLRRIRIVDRSRGFNIEFNVFQLLHVERVEVNTMLRLHIRARSYPNRANKLRSIKCIRAVTRCSLQEAKDVVDALWENPNLVHVLEVDNTLRNDLDLYNIQIPSTSESLNMYEHFYIHIVNTDDTTHVPNESNTSNTTTPVHIETIQDMETVMKQSIVKLLDEDAPEVLQSAIIFYNTIKKHLKNRQI